MKNIDIMGHVTGKSLFIDDIPVQKGTLHAVLVVSKVAHGVITATDTEEALAYPGVRAVISSSSIPGINQAGGIISDEPLLADGELHYYGQPVMIVVAEERRQALAASGLVKILTEEKEAIFDPRIAAAEGQLLIPPRTFRTGDIEQAWQNCSHIVEGRADTGGQEHLYLETQGAYAYPSGRGIKIHSSTQAPTAVQKIAARVLGLPMNLIEVDVSRLGGGFGGKEDQATGFATMAALAAYLLNKPVKLVLDRDEDMMITGKRHPYSADFRIGLSSDMKILAYKATLWQNGGASADLSPAIMERTLFHSTGAYYVPNSEVRAYSCRTNLPPNTAFRGFGAPQGMFVIESAIAKAAEELGISASVIQETNLLKEGDSFQYGQTASGVTIGACSRRLKEIYRLKDLENSIVQFNASNIIKKRGMALMPLCFGISFTTTHLNQGRALVHIYTDGSVGISTGAIEMGQGVNTKLTEIAASTLGIDVSLVKIESTNTTRVANTSPTAASSGADLNGKALIGACLPLVERLKHVASDELNCQAEELEFIKGVVVRKGEPSLLTWEKVVEKAYLKRVCLTENGHYATPSVWFDKSTEKGNPFAYHVYGMAAVTVTLDCLRGEFTVDDVLIVHDFGKSLNSVIDMGQTEGGVVMGIGWVTMEEIVFSAEGRLLSDSLSNYKVPDIYSVPANLKCHPLETDIPNEAVLGSKAVGEPPFMYGIGAWFAIRNAVRAFNPATKMLFETPLTNEKILKALYNR